MSLLWTMMKISFMREYIYRGNTYITILRNFLYLFISVSIWKSLYGTNEEVNGIPLSEMMSFLIIGLLVRNLTRSNISDLIANKVREGQIVSDMLKPMSLNASIFAQQFGQNLYLTLFSAIPVCVAASLFYEFELPAQSLHFVFFTISIILGMALMYYLDYVLGLLSFWLKSGLYIEFFLGAMFEIFSGSIIPLWFYPEFLKDICMLLPFRLIAFEPISIYLGKYSYAYALQIIMLQLVWILSFVALGKWIWYKAQQAITIQGG